MRKSLLLFILLIATSTIIAQEKDKNKTSLFPKGKWLIEANTGFGTVHSANTGINFSSSNGTTNYNIGFEGGYFLLNRLALKVGLGYGRQSSSSTQTSNGGEGGNEGPEGSPEGGNEGGSEGGLGSLSGGIFSYKIGAKYYFIDRIPLQLDFSGTNVTGGDYFLGLQGGYAIFLGEKKNISIEPGLRYNVSLNSPLPNQDVFQFNVGFVLHF